MAKKSFVMYESWMDMIDSLPDEQALELMRAISAFQKGNEVKITNPILKAYFETTVMPEMESNRDKYQAKVENANASARKRTKANESESKANESESKANESESKANESDSVNVDVNEDVDVDVNEDVDVDVNGSAKADKKSKPHARKHGEYGHVRLTDEQLQKLEEEHGQSETAAAIKKVDEYCEETGKTYKNYYLVIKRWGYAATPTARSGTTGYVDAVHNRFDAIKDWLEDSKNDTGGVFADSGSYEGGIHRPEIPAG